MPLRASSCWYIEFRLLAARDQIPSGEKSVAPSSKFCGQNKTYPSFVTPDVIRGPSARVGNDEGKLYEPQFAGRLAERGAVGVGEGEAQRKPDRARGDGGDQR